MTATWPEHFAPTIVGRALGNSALSSYSIALEAWRRGLEVTFTSDELRFYTIADDHRLVEFDYSRPKSITDSLAAAIANDKSATLSLLQESGVRVPRGMQI